MVIVIHIFLNRKKTYYIRFWPNIYWINDIIRRVVAVFIQTNSEISKNTETK